MSTPLRASTPGGSPLAPATPTACPNSRLRSHLPLLGGLALTLSLIGCMSDPSRAPITIRNASAPYIVAKSTMLPDAPPGTPRPTATIDTAIAPWVPMTLAQRVAFFENVWALVRDNYVYPDYRGLDWQAIHEEFLRKSENEVNPVLFYDLMEEMIDRLDDRHSWFADPEQASWEDLHQQTKDDDLVGSVGLFGAMLDDAFRVREVIPGSPADKAGIRRSDILQAVDGNPIVSEAGALLLLNGPPGTTTTLLIESPGQGPHKVELTRAEGDYVPEPHAMIWPATHIVYLDVPSFDQKGMNTKVHDQLTRLTDQRLDGLIIDLRENGGGLVREMRRTLALFINGGYIGYDVYRDWRAPIWLPADLTLASFKGKPTVILIDQRSGSASEVFTAGMHYRGAGIVLGTASLGNTETIYPYNLAGGCRLYLAEARYVLPDDTSIEDVGVHPDIVEEAPWYLHPPEEDPQVLAAIKYIKNHHK